MNFEYLLFNLIVVLGPALALFFYPKVTKLQTKAAIFSIGIFALVFIIWDIIVTGYFWYFNPKYVLGYKLWTIPFEEALFFFTIPFACLFLYINFIEKIKNKKQIKPILINIIILFLAVFGIVFLFLGKYYTSAVLCLLGLVWFIDQYLIKISLVSRYIYWQFMVILLFLTFCFNYYLTSRPVVIYNDAVNINLRILTIPVEDFFYSISLISLILIFYEYFNPNR